MRFPSRYVYYIYSCIKSGERAAAEHINKERHDSDLAKQKLT